LGLLVRNKPCGNPGINLFGGSFIPMGIFCISLSLSLSLSQRKSRIDVCIGLPPPPVLAPKRNLKSAKQESFLKHYWIRFVQRLFRFKNFFQLALRGHSEEIATFKCAFKIHVCI
jgi:hypothetical protein